MSDARLSQLSSAEAHAHARVEWEEFFADSVRGLGLRRSWVDWLNATYQACMPHDDAFTILSKKCDDCPLGFQFELHLPEEGSPVVHSYWRKFGEGMLAEPVRHFVITAAASSEGIAEGRKLLLQWLSSHDQCE